jgi:hypothetical protein
MRPPIRNARPLAAAVATRATTAGPPTPKGLMNHDETAGMAEQFIGFPRNEAF